LNGDSDSNGKQQSNGNVDINGAWYDGNGNGNGNGKQEQQRNGVAVAVAVAVTVNLLSLLLPLLAVNVDVAIAVAFAVNVLLLLAVSIAVTPLLSTLPRCLPLPSRCFRLLIIVCWEASSVISKTSYDPRRGILAAPAPVYIAASVAASGGVRVGSQMQKCVVELDVPVSNRTNGTCGNRTNGTCGNQTNGTCGNWTNGLVEIGQNSVEIRSLWKSDENWPFGVENWF